MSIQPKKNFMKQFVSIAGVASASVALSLPAFALTNADAGSFNQFANNQTSRTDLVAQQSGSDRPTTGGSNTNQRSTTGGTNNTNQRNTSTNQTPRTSTMEENGRMNRRLLTGGDSVRGVIFRCLNNPNPSCGS
ncbi:MAG: hypothetical protein ICV63_18925 [Coleofasciculus sp. Co-bin14]|nr:hypothetical protein [Coleofasciculus sp. Co-bin14]